MLLLSFFLVAAYLFGSVNSAIIICKLMNLPDPRSGGSQNPGATNVKRVGGTGAAIMVLIFDLLKGFLPVLLLVWLSPNNSFLGFVALAAVTGHIFPLFFDFKGGKGVATAFGALFALSFPLGFLALIIFFVTVALSRYVSLASILALISTPVLALIIGYFSYVLPLLMIAALIVYRHKSNIKRLRDGTESKIKLM